MPDPNFPRRDNIPDMSLGERTAKPHVPKGPPPDSTGYSQGGSQPAVRTDWKKGDRVFAPWEPTFLYAGTISKFAGDQALIEFDDGDSGWVDLAFVEPMSLQRGQRVLSRRRMGPTFYPGEIAEVNGENVRVRFDDGSDDERTTVAAVRVPCEARGQGARQVSIKSTQAFLEHLREGDRVWALWDPAQALFVGVVTKMEERRAHIRFDDGDKAWVAFEHLMPFDPMVGMPVMGRWKMGQAFYPGTITDVKGERIHISYQDGDEEWTTPAALAIPIGAPPPVPAAPQAIPRSPRRAPEPEAPRRGVSRVPPPAKAWYQLPGVWIIGFILVAAAIGLIYFATR